MTDPVDTDALLVKLRRAHRMSCSDPTDPSRRTLYSAAADEVDRLRAVIENAPHDPFGCGLVRALQRTDYCNCWKADAL